MNPLLEHPGLAGTLGGAFYLHGEDSFRKEEVLRALVELHLDPATRDFNLDMLRGSDVSAETLASVMGTPPLMADWRVVVVREVEALASSARSRDILLSAVSHPPPGLALVLSCTVPDGSKARFYTELARLTRSAAFPAMTVSDVPGWLMERALQRYGVEMEPEAAQGLGAAVGTNLGILNQELEKLAGYVGDRKRITFADVEAAGTRLPEQDRWRWFDMVAEGRLEEALDAVDTLFAQNETGVSLVVGLATHFLRLGVAVEGEPGALEATLPAHQRWLAKKLRTQARLWRGVEIEGALAGLLRADALLKSSGFSEEHFVEEWLLTLLARKAAA